MSSSSYTLKIYFSISSGTPRATAPGNSVLGNTVLDSSVKKNAFSISKNSGTQFNYWLGLVNEIINNVELWIIRLPHTNDDIALIDSLLFIINFFF